MRAWAPLMILLSGCTSPSLPAQRPTDFSIAYRRSAMTAPAVGDSWRLDAAGWTFEAGMGGGKAIAGPAEPQEIDTAYQAVRGAGLERMESKIRDGVIMDGHSETLTIVVSGKTKVLTTGTHHQLVAGDPTSYRRAVDELGKLADGALARLRDGPPR